MLSSKYRLLEFSGTWCASCQRMKPTVERAVNDLGNIELVEVDVDKEPNLSREFQVRSIPMLVLLNEDGVLGTLVGNRSLEDIKKFLIQVE